MDVVPAGVHDALFLGGERKAAFLRQRERVDVGAQNDRRPGERAAQLGERSRIADRAPVKPKPCELFADPLRGPILLPARLRVAVEVMPELVKLAADGGEVLPDRIVNCRGRHQCVLLFAIKFPMICSTQTKAMSRSVVIQVMSVM